MHASDICFLNILSRSWKCGSSSSFFMMMKRSQCAHFSGNINILDGIVFKMVYISNKIDEWFKGILSASAQNVLFKLKFSMNEHISSSINRHSRIMHKSFMKYLSRSIATVISIFVILSSFWYSSKIQSSSHIFFFVHCYCLIYQKYKFQFIAIHLNISYGQSVIFLWKKKINKSK